MKDPVVQAKEKLDAEQLAFERRGYVWDEVTSAAWDTAYEAWMQARGMAGDRFALLLGYGPGGWSFERWLAGHQHFHRRSA